MTIQPAGAVFNPPAPITLPNVDGLKPRAVTEMYSFDHDIGSFVAIGTGIVSDDGQVIRSSPGVGVLKAGWHCGGDPSKIGTVADCPECRICQINGCVPDQARDNTICQGDSTRICHEGTCKKLDIQALRADVTQDLIVVQLGPSGLSGTLQLELIGRVNHTIRTETRSAGTLNESFGIPNLAIGEYTGARATWTVGPASASGELNYRIQVLGRYRHSQYNTPRESRCTSAPAPAYITNAQCRFTPTTLRSDFIITVNRNGSGSSINFGDVQVE